MVVKSLLMGSYGAMKYEKARSEGSKAPVAAGKAIVKNNANIALGGVPSIYEYIKNRQARKRGK